ncbi:phosphomannomutase/phosphoglucomutase [Desulfotomaculum copahuensis]|uniref:Phosphomannomutase n=1 Tax=Desulfotomaculum copahuensis TaxID=1838280 RepID=A0A1B7LCQ9_9FIRM|nr:phosphomannomutase/phosphoglucomutase [Desulfotomaculum copahuensis]OAT80716.1 hypothetical protein A6M21_12705 [Desulfotomaculum copahuensis]
MGIFKPCDIRGVYNRELTERDARNLGLAAGSYIHAQTVLVAGDVRLSTPALKAALCNGLTAAGCRVIDAGILTTPAFNFAVRHAGTAAGIMVTASHNPPEYNGFKIVFAGRPVQPAELTLLEQIITGRDFVTGRGSYRRDETWLSRYRNYLTGHFKPGRLKVVLDCGNGACSLIAPHVFRSLGYQVTELYCTPDGRFPNRPPNPALPENLRDLRRRVVAEDAAAGIAYDGDGDRVALVDESGGVVANDRLLAMLARHLLSRGKGAIVYDSKCSLIVPEEISRHGGTPLMARSGHTFVQSRFLSSHAILAGELSGHFFWREPGFDDGLFSSLVLSELLAESGTTLSRLNDELPHYRITPDIRLPFAGDPGEIMDGVLKKLSRFPVSTLDGVRVEFPDCWGMIRPSVTEPILTFRFEGKTGERLSFIISLMLSALPEELRAKAEKALAGA